MLLKGVDLSACGVVDLVVIVWMEDLSFYPTVMG